MKKEDTWEGGTGKTYVAPPRDPKSIQFDLSTSEGNKIFAQTIDNLQCVGANWKLQQDGCLVWVVLS